MSNNCKLLSAFALLLAILSTPVSAKASSDAAGFIPAAPGQASLAGATNYACLNVRNAGAHMMITVQFATNTYPYEIVGGWVNSGLCGAPYWQVTGGSMDGERLDLQAVRTGGGSCVSTMELRGDFQNPASYQGAYAYDNQTVYDATTLFLGFQPCP